MLNEHQIVIVGGGVIGLSIGWQLVRRGCRVTIFEKGRTGQGASHVAAGMLAPHAEAEVEEVALLKLGEHSLRCYPRFAEALKEDSGIDPMFERCGTLFAGLDRDDTEFLRRLYQFRKELNLEAEWVGAMEVRNREPLLAPGVTSGVWLPNDGQVNNRLLIKSLKKAFQKRGGELLEITKVSHIDINNHRDFTLHTADGTHHTETVVVATGCRCPEIKGLPEKQLPPVRPVKGQIISLRQSKEVRFRHIIRTPRVYMVPKSDGLIRVGATTEEKGFDTEITAGGLKELLDEAWEALPAVYDLEVAECMAGLRPATPDHGPAVGMSDVSGLYFSTGHYRNGILLAPVTACEVAKEIAEGVRSHLLDPWRPARFN